MQSLKLGEDSHVVDLHVSVVGAGEELLRVRGEGEGADGHGVALQGLEKSKNTTVNVRLKVAKRSVYRAITAVYGLM